MRLCILTLHLNRKKGLLLHKENDTWLEMIHFHLMLRLRGLIESFLSPKMIVIFNMYIHLLG